MYKERKVVYLRCDVCGQEFDQNSEDGVTNIRHNSFMNE